MSRLRFGTVLGNEFHLRPPGRPHGQSRPTLHATENELSETVDKNVRIFMLTQMNALSLGDAIRQLRDKADFSLRELATKIGISAPHLSDIELGKRYPSDDVLRELAKVLKAPFDELKRYDTRPAFSDIKRIMETNPRIGFAMRTVAEEFKRGELSADELIKRISRKGSAP